MPSADSRGGGHDPRAGFPTRGICLLLVCVGLAMVAARIAVVRSTTGEVPFLGANDRSRWATVSALVDDGTYAIDRQLEIRDSRTRRRTWQTIDLVRHRGEDGRQHYYSSKPPLLPTMIAGVYAAVRGVTGSTLEQRPFFVGRWVLALVNLPMVAILYGCLVSVILSRRMPAWGAVFLTSATVFGTLVTPFAVTLNNHLPAAMATAVALWCFVRFQKRCPTPFLSGWMFLAGVAAGFAVANELPALSMAAVWSVLAVRRDWIRGLTAFAPGALLVAVAFFGTNWLAHQTFRPAYAHRTVGAEVASFPANSAVPEEADLRAALEEAALAAAGPVAIEPSRTPGRWRAHFPDSDQLWAIERVGAGAADGRFVVRQWDDWYDYPGSYWTADKLAGVDRGEPSRAVYAVHMLAGHHGVFSLTPLWLLSLGGSVLWMVRGSRFQQKGSAEGEAMEASEAEGDPLFPRLLAAAIVAVTLVCMLFYVARPLIDRNYGGVSVAFRWLLWLVPLWIWLAVPAVAVLQRSLWGRRICGVLLVGSVFSVFAALENPWSHPWIYRYMDYLGWIAD